MTTLPQLISEMLTMADPYKLTYATENNSVCIFRISVQFWIRICIDSPSYAVINCFAYVNISSNQRLIKKWSILRCRVL